MSNIDYKKKTYCLMKKLPKIGTKAYHDYLSSWNEIGKFLHFVLFMVSRIDNMASIAHNALLESFAEDVEEREKLLASENSRVSMIDVLREHKQFLMETLHVRLVDNFLNYISSLLFEVYTKKPQTLKSGESIDFSTLLECDSMNSIVRILAEIKTSKLVYKSYYDINKYFCDTLGVAVSEVNNDEIVFSIELRNIIVHNRCLVDKRFVKKTKAEKKLIGKKFDMHIGIYEKCEYILLPKVIEFDKNVRKHLRLVGHKEINE